MNNPKGLALCENINVSKVISDFYYEIPEDFSYGGEKHAGWEFVFVEGGKVRAGADNATYILKRGEMVCHKPNEFHTIRPAEKNTSVIILCFESDNGYMEYFNNKILSLNQRQKQYLNRKMDTY